MPASCSGNSHGDLDFGLGETADLLRENVRGFAVDKIAPRADEIDRSNGFPVICGPRSARWVFMA